MLKPYAICIKCLNMISTWKIIFEIIVDRGLDLPRAFRGYPFRSYGYVRFIPGYTYSLDIPTYRKVKSTYFTISHEQIYYLC